MGAKKLTKEEKVSELFWQRNSPKEIARKTNLRFKEVMDILFRLVGEGLIRRSAIWFSINHEIRETLETYFLEIDKIKEYDDELLKIVDIIDEHPEEFHLYMKLKSARVAHGDMYELISEIELLFHRAVKNVLIKEYGPDELEWWRKGVPDFIRKDCRNRYEDDDDPVKEPFCYTTLINLKIIIDKQWSLFHKILPKTVVNDKKAFLKKLDRINQIRNRVMHPSKGYDFKPKDFEFIHEFHSIININNWQDKDITK